jgi:GDP-4-dehydro-6-deoxy-D-mannose reductase
VRAYVTGASGFVGRWLLDHLRASGDEVIAPEVELTDAAALTSALAAARPDAVYHLAAVANVGESWGDPRHTFAVNAVGTLNLLEAARALDPAPVVLLVCSAEVYGRVTPDELPLREDAPLRPVSPYAASKVAAEYLGVQAHLAYGLPVVRARAFNHIGPGQAPTFVVSSLARQIARAAIGGGAVVEVGNLTPRRDYTDVRDVVRAYRLLVEHGRPGEVYNVCSGEDVAVSEVAARLIALAAVDVELRVVDERVRDVDVPVLRGDPGRLVAATGWHRERSLDETLADVLGDWKRALAGSERR